jgi:mannose-6-phosphate isomerase-like protein (cupin superfamily)
MEEAILIPAAGGELVGDSPDRRVEILSDADSLHATWSRFGPGRDGADLHVHRDHTDLFFVLEGELTVRLGPQGNAVTVEAGALALVPPMVVHGFRNAGDVEVRYLNLHAPGQGFADYMRAVRDGRQFSYDQHPPPADGGRPSSEAVIGERLRVVERPGRQLEVLADRSEIAIAAVVAEPGATVAEAAPADRVDSFYVLEGELALSAGDRELRAEAGAFLQITPGIPRSLAFGGSGPVRYLSLRTPPQGLRGARNRG